MTSAVTIQADLIAADERKLLTSCFEKVFMKTGTVHLSALGRVGKSGAKILSARFDGKGVQFVVKINAKNKIKIEIEAIKKVFTSFRDCPPVNDYKILGNKGAIIYKHAGGDEKTSFPLADVLYPRAKAANDCAAAQKLLGPGQTSELVRFVDKMFENSHLSDRTLATVRKISLLNEYAWYLRNHEAPYNSRERLACMLGKDGHRQKITLFNRAAVSPLWAIDKGFREERDYLATPVHGDLHPNNIIIGGDGSPHLIDFEWASDQAHYLKDFVLLENSIRFLAFPGYVEQKLRNKLDEALLHEDGFQDKSLAPKTGLASEACKRMLGMVRSIRKKARETGGKEFSFDDYLAAQFLVLYGLLKFDQYNSPAVLGTLSLIATRLQKTRHCSIS